MRTVRNFTALTTAACTILICGGCSSVERADGATARPAPVAASPRVGPSAIPVAFTPEAEPTASAGAVGLLFLDETPNRFGHSSIDASDNLAQVTFAREGADFDPDISPDGSLLVYASTQHRATADIYVKSVRGQAVTQLTNDPAQDVMPAISPDGRRVAFCSNRNGSWDIFLVGINGGQPVQITSESTHELHPTWSPDGRHIAFCRLNPRSRQWELWVVDASNPSAAKFIGHGLMPEWSPTGDLIAFQKPRDRGERLYSIWTISYAEGEARNPTEVASDPHVAFVNPTWSPDGTRLAFAAVANPTGPIVGGLGFKPGSAQIWMINADGSGRTPLTDGPFVSVIPRWAPDGRVYFVSNRAGTENVWSLSPGLAIQTASFDDAHTPPTHSIATTNRGKGAGKTAAKPGSENPGALPGVLRMAGANQGSKPTSENQPADAAEPMMQTPQPTPTDFANVPPQEGDGPEDH